MIKSLEAGKIVETNRAETFADGIRVLHPSKEMLAILKEVVDEYYDIADEHIAASVLEFIEQARIISEGAAAITLATLDRLYGENPGRFADKNVVLLVSGGNIDVNLVDRIIDRGLVESKRRTKLSVHLPDIPGSLGALTTLISELGANILEVAHNRNALHLELKESIVEVTMETKGEDHLNSILSLLKSNYRKVDVASA